MLDPILSYRDEAQLVCMVLLLAAALRWGAGPERACAAALSALFVLDLLNHAIFGQGAYYRTVDLGHATVDAVVAVLLVGVALFANRMYPLWLAAFQLISLSSHLVRELSPRMDAMAYFAMFVAPSYLQLATLAIGIAAHARRHRRYGRYRSWRTSSFPSLAKDPPASPKG